MKQEAIDHVLKAEGGFVNNPNDSAGSTNFGITWRTLEKWRGHKVTVEDVRNMTVDEARLIYEEYYWKPLGLDQLNKPKLASMLFDQGVNRGLSAVTKTVQHMLGITPDGAMGPHTIGALNAYADEKALCMKFIKASQIEYVRICKGNPSQLVFLEGWINRTHRMMDEIA